jgi:hypothetical protein
MSGEYVLYTRCSRDGFIFYPAVYDKCPTTVWNSSGTKRFDTREKAVTYARQIIEEGGNVYYKVLKRGGPTTRQVLIDIPDSVTYAEVWEHLTARWPELAEARCF